MSKMEEFQKAAEEEERKFRETYGQAGEDQPAEAVAEPTPTDEPAAEPVATEEIRAEPEPTPNPVPVEEPKVVDESKYKAAVKAMNEAQRKAAEAAKREEELAKREAELETRLRNLSAPPKPTAQPEPEDDLEQDLPEVAKIAERKARKAVSTVESRIEQLEKQLKEERELRVKMASEDASVKMLSQIRAAHPDYDEMVNSDEMVAWVNNDAPPIYKAIFDGTIPFQARDAIAVLDAYKSTLTPKTKPQVSKTSPSAAEIAAPVKTNTQIATKMNTEEPPTAKELEWFMHNSHKLNQEDLAKWDRRISLL